MMETKSSIVASEGFGVFIANAVVFVKITFRILNETDLVKLLTARDYKRE